MSFVKKENVPATLNTFLVLKKYFLNNLQQSRYM